MLSFIKKSLHRHGFLFAALLFSTVCFSQTGQTVTGDFNGDGKTDTAFVKTTYNAHKKTTDHTLRFSNKSIPAVQLGCCDVILISEGDLDNDKATDISVFQAPENGCLWLWTTYSLRNNRWKPLIDPFVVPTYCEEIPAADLDKKVFRENGTIYYWDVDLNDETGKPIKRPAILRSAPEAASF